MNKTKVDWALIGSVLRNNGCLVDRELELFEVTEQEVALTDMIAVLYVDGGIPKGIDIKKLEDKHRDDFLRVKTEHYPVKKSMTLARLKHFVGEPMWPSLKECSECHGTEYVTCPECDGTGEFTCFCPNCCDTHEAECEECAGTGKVLCRHDVTRTIPPEDRVIFIKTSLGDLSFDKMVLARMLDFCPDEECVDVEFDNTRGNKMRISGNDWVFVIAGVTLNQSYPYKNEQNTFVWEGK